MAPDRLTALFFELFSGLPRQGPGTTASTRRALGLVPGVGPRTRVLDVGCGTGAQTLVLAHSSPARIVAVDNHPPFIDVLNRRARRLGITNRVKGRVADMHRLDFADGAFDLIWCEGAIYNVGLEAGLRDWRRLLRGNGHVALTEVCWRTPQPPAECAAFWNRVHDHRSKLMVFHGLTEMPEYGIPRCTPHRRERAARAFARPPRGAPAGPSRTSPKRARPLPERLLVRRADRSAPRRPSRPAGERRSVCVAEFAIQIRIPGGGPTSASTRPRRGQGTCRDR